MSFSSFPYVLKVSIIFLFFTSSRELCWWRVPTVKLLIMQFFPASCYCLPLRPIYLPQHTSLEHPQPILVLNFSLNFNLYSSLLWQSFTPIKTTVKTNNLDRTRLVLFRKSIIHRIYMTHNFYYKTVCFYKITKCFEPTGSSWGLYNA